MFPHALGNTLSDAKRIRFQTKSWRTDRQTDSQTDWHDEHDGLTDWPTDGQDERTAQLWFDDDTDRQVCRTESRRQKQRYPYVGQPDIYGNHQWHSLNIALTTRQVAEERASKTTLQYPNGRIKCWPWLFYRSLMVIDRRMLTAWQEDWWSSIEGCSLLGRWMLFSSHSFFSLLASHAVSLSSFALCYKYTQYKLETRRRNGPTNETKVMPSVYALYYKL